MTTVLIEVPGRTKAQLDTPVAHVVDGGDHLGQIARMPERDRRDECPVTDGPRLADQARDDCPARRWSATTRARKALVVIRSIQGVEAQPPLHAASGPLEAASRFPAGVRSSVRIAWSVRPAQDARCEGAVGMQPRTILRRRPELLRHVLERPAVRAVALHARDALIADGGEVGAAGPCQSSVPSGRGSCCSPGPKSSPSLPRS